MPRFHVHDLYDKRWTSTKEISLSDGTHKLSDAIERVHFPPSYTQVVRLLIEVALSSSLAQSVWVSSL